mmetsp:Transcript_45543/g.50713  ORF Transcript_45543/g.50713 Transcript_45543/m.50713 type:complete len:92 (-) Transcript_45543:36-311(-)
MTTYSPSSSLEKNEAGFSSDVFQFLSLERVKKRKVFTSSLIFTCAALGLKAIQNSVDNINGRAMLIIIQFPYQNALWQKATSCETTPIFIF